MTTSPEYEGVVDLRRYPIGEPGSQEYQALVAACQDQLRDRGVARPDALEIAIFDDGDELGWHFDNSEFSVTVMYQESEAGGHFEYRPWLRDERDENYHGVQQVLLGRLDGVITLPSRPGTLAVFRGQHALHRVTPVRGPRPRINSVLTYGEHPGMTLNRLTQELFYGRTAP